MIRSAQAEVRSCYEAILTPVYHPDVDLTLRLALRANGTVRRVDVVKLEPDVSGFIACLAACSPSCASRKIVRIGSQVSSAFAQRRFGT